VAVPCVARLLIVERRRELRAQRLELGTFLLRRRLLRLREPTRLALEALAVALDLRRNLVRRRAVLVERSALRLERALGEPPLANEVALLPRQRRPVALEPVALSRRLPRRRRRP
jgi:hypothetical protein